MPRAGASPFRRSARSRLALGAVTAAVLGSTTFAASGAVAAEHPTTVRPRAAAGSLVYVKGGAITLAHSDGSSPVVVKTGTYRWPSMDDKGVIAAERPDGRTAPDGSAGYSIYRYTQAGRKLSSVATPVDYSSSNCPVYPSSHVSLSPDGTKVAYDYTDACVGGNTATWTPSTQMTLHTFTDYTAPAWLSTSKMIISHFGMTLTSSQAEIGTWGTDNTSSGWSADLADSWATAYHATATRDGKIVALLEDDAADYFDGVPRHVSLVLGTSSGPGQAITRRCTLPLPTTRYDASNWGGTTFASMSFNPTGTVLAFDAENGLWKANTSNLGTCSTVAPALWIKGAYDGFFSPAADTR